MSRRMDREGVEAPGCELDSLTESAEGTQDVLWRYEWSMRVGVAAWHREVMRHLAEEAVLP